MEQQLLVDLFNQYNERVAAIYERLVSESDDLQEDQEVSFLQEVETQIQAEAASWLDESILLSGQSTSPRTILATFVDPEAATALFLTAARICDHDVPAFVTRQLLAAGPAAIAELSRAVLDAPWSAVQQWTEPDSGKQPDLSDTGLASAEFEFQAVAISRGLEWLATQADPRLHEGILEKFCATEAIDELMESAVRTYFIRVGPPVLPLILDRLNTALASHQSISGPLEQVLLLLVDIGKRQRSPAIFNCLRACFRIMPDKMIGAICLADYGDPRGIAALKSWLDQHIQNINKPLYLELVAAIKKLGGDISDIGNPFY